MEVIPLDDRVRSTTVLNTAAPSDFTTVYADDNYEIDAPDAFNDQPAAEDLAADAANEGMWTRRNKLLLSLIGGSALLCAIATGSGVAAHRARVANLNKCPAGMVPNVGATGSVNPPPAPASAKSSKSPTAKSSKSTSGPAPPAIQRALTGATVEEEEEVSVGGAYYPSVPKTVEDKRKNRMLAEHLGQRDASSTLSWKLKNTLGEMMPKLNFGSDEEQQRLNYERRLQATLAPSKSSKSPSAKSSKSPTAKSSKSSSGLVGGIVDGLKPSDNCKCVNGSGLTRSGSGGGSSGKSSKSPSAKASKSPSAKASKSPSAKASKSPSAKASKSPTAKSAKSSSGLVGGLPGLAPTIPTMCNAPVAPLSPTSPMAPGSKSSKSPTSKSGKSTPVPVPTQPAPTVPTPAVVEPIPPETKPPTPPPVTKPPPAITETKPPATPAPTPCTVDCPGVPVVDPTSPTPGGGGGENPSVPKPPPTPGTGELTPPVPTPPTPGTPDGGPTPSTTTPNCDNDDGWSSEDGETCDDVANGDANVLCVTASSVGGTSASVACPAVCNTECLPNCDNDDGWSSEDGKTCDDVAEDPIGLCLNADKSPSEAFAACPASCNKECFVNCDNDPLWIGSQDGETCDDVAENTKLLCDRLNSELVAASEACPAACNNECAPPTVDIPVTFPTRFPKLDSYEPTPETTVGVTVTVGEKDKTPPTFSPSRVVGGLTPEITPMPTNLGTSVGSSGGTITVSTETTGPPTLAIRDDEDEQGDDEESVR